MTRIVIIIILHCRFPTYSQNLVPNPGFELFITCPSGMGKIDNAIPWFQPYTGGASSTDNYNSCTSNWLNTVPTNYSGYQYPMSGTGYAGFQTWYMTREYLEVQLIDSLVQGQEYCVSFYVSLPERFMLASDGVGAYFSTNAVYYSTPFYGVLPLQPQVENPSGNIIVDSINWVLISGSFIATGGEKYVTIGNFKNDNQTNTIQVDATGEPMSYFYIDDVSVVPGNCTTGINDQNSSQNQISVYPNPTTGTVTLCNFDKGTIELYDASGLLVMSTMNKNELDVSSYANGLYILKITSLNGQIAYKKLVLNK